MKHDETFYVTIGTALSAVHIVRRRNRNMYLRILSDGSLSVSCAPWVTKDEIERFIHEKEKWILKNEQSVRIKNEVNREGLSPYIYWLGERKPVRYQEGRRSICLIDGNEIVMELRQLDEQCATAAFRASARAELSSLIDERRGQWDEKICRANGIPVPRISLRYMTSRWGVCQTAKAHITISTRLIHYPTVCLDYVLLHEYVHFLVPNHSARFYAIVEKYMPAYKSYESLLK